LLRNELLATNAYVRLPITQGKAKDKRKRRIEQGEEGLEYHREAQKRFREKYPDKVVANNLKFRLENPEYQREYDTEHPESRHDRNRRRYVHLMLNANNDLTIQQWEEIKAAFGYRCAYCGCKSKRLTKDHITPISKGGAHTASNIVPACSLCNSKKHAGAPLIPVQPLLLTLAPPDRKRYNNS
jgi:5-methylcytosine-specific restriction endonuclease McrA